MALFLLVSMLVQSKTKQEPTGTNKELISKSQAFILQGDRPKACQILISALNKDGVKTKGYAEISKALKKCTELFVSEKAQQVYEVAIASYASDKNQTIEKFREALNIEPLNSLIIKGLIFTLLSQNECNQAKKKHEDLKKISPYDEDLESFRVLELICSKNKSEALAIIVKLDPAILSQPFWIVNKQRLLIEKTDSPISIDVLFKDYPEIFYVDWLNEKKPKERIFFAEKYKQLCHNPVSFDTAYKYTDPWICFHLKEIEEYLAKGERG